jgi:hypothetical protein
MLRPPVTVDKGIRKSFPVRLAVFEMRNLPVCNILDAHALEFGPSRMSCDILRHGPALSE